jgi:tRNA modification GTPase
VVWNKVDLPSPALRDGIAISAKLDIGMNTLLARMTGLVAARLETQNEAPVITRARHRHALVAAAAALERALATDQTELFAEDMRLAVRAIGRITGRVDVEELLDVVFRDFCIGK